MSAGKVDLSALLKNAFEKLETARILYENARYDDAVSRAYYAAFTRNFVRKNQSQESNVLPLQAV